MRQADYTRMQDFLFDGFSSALAIKVAPLLRDAAALRHPSIWGPALQSPEPFGWEVQAIEER